MYLENKNFLEEIGRGAIIAFISIIVGTVLQLSFSYLIIFLTSPVLYGLFSILSRLTPILTISVGGIESGLYRTLPRLEQDEQNAVITSAIIIYFFIAILIIFGVSMGMDILIKYTSLNTSNSIAIFVFALGIPFIVLINIVSAVFKSYKKIGLANLVSTISNPLSKLIGMFLGLLFISETLFGLLSGIFISTIF